MTDEAGPDLAWVVVPGDQVPERWTARARPVALVPLLPDEMARLLAGDAPGASSKADLVRQLTELGFG